jgi:hypothetical protein
MNRHMNIILFCVSFSNPNPINCADYCVYRRCFLNRHLPNGHRGSFDYQRFDFKIWDTSFGGGYLSGDRTWKFDKITSPRHWTWLRVTWRQLSISLHTSLRSSVVNKSPAVSLWFSEKSPFITLYAFLDSSVLVPLISLTEHLSYANREV